ncbi:MAG: autotransporter domain-containing protein, partial [Planctomycetaceae bacterium]|nr:autotransporter domain-containing protein [Planctomycetaceae bacterium]
DITNTNKFSGAGTLNKIGTQKLTLSADNALNETLDVNVNAGELELTGTNNNYTGNVNLATSTTLIVNSNTNSTFAGTITGNGNFEQQGSNSLTLTGNNTATGNFNHLNGTVNLQSNWNGNYYQSANAILNLGNSVKIGGDAEILGVVNIADKLEVGGNFTYKNTSDALDLTGSKSVAAGKTFELENGTKMNFTIAPNKIQADTVILNGEITVINTSDIADGQIHNVIVANTTLLDQPQLNSLFTLSQKLLTSTEPFYSSDGKSMGITKYSQSAEQYTIDNHFKNNQTQIAGLLDNYASIQSTLYSLDNREQLENLIRPLLVTEVAAEADNLPMHHPYFHVFNHLANLPLNNFRNVNNSRSANFNGIVRGQSPCSPINRRENTKREFWFEGYYRSEKIDGNANALGYKTSHGGLMIGVDQVIGNRLMTGLVFGYGNPHVQHSAGQIEADDYTLGLYSRLKLSNVSEIYLNSFVGYGNQHYELRQNFTNSNTNYNGDSFYASLELYRSFHLRNKIILSPLIAIDFQKAWSEGFKVNVTDLPLSVNKNDLDQTVLRIGVNSSYKNLRTRLQYGYQVAGDLYSISRTSITGNNTNNNRIITGVHLGRNTLNLGFGGDFKTGKRTKLFADYDFDLGEHSTSHTGQFGFVRDF